MYIDEFLISNEQRCETEKNTLLKVGYNEDIFFLYKPNYSSKLEYGSALECIGLFDKKHKQLYGNTYYFKYEQDLISQFYKGAFEEIGRDFQRNIDLLLNNYVRENYDVLKEMAKESFEKYISYENNLYYMKKEVTNKYIYNEEKTELEFEVNTYKYEREKEKNKLLMEYLQFPKKVAIRVFEEYITNPEKSETFFSHTTNEPNIEVTIKEYIGNKILENEMKSELLQEIKNNPDKDLKKKHDIINAIKEVDANMLTIKLKHNNQEITFKYPRDQLYNFHIYSYSILDKTSREKVGEIYSGENKYDYFQIEDIASITYKREVLYEDKDMLKNEIENDKSEEINYDYGG